MLDKVDMPAVSYSEALSILANREPHRPAVTAKDGLITRLELVRRSDAVARELSKMGLGRDDVIAITGDNTIQTITLSMAIWRVGAIPLGLWRDKMDSETEAQLALGRPKMVLGFPPHIGCDTQRLNADALYRSALGSVDQYGILPKLPYVTGSAMRIGASGGSTGSPKLIIVKAPPVIDPDRPWPAGMSSNGTQLMARDVSDPGGFVFVPIALGTGNYLIVMEKFDPEQTLMLLEKYRVDFVALTQPMMLMMWKLAPDIRGKYDLSSLKAVGQYSSGAPKWLKRAWIQWLGPERVWETYGATDSRGSTTINGVEWLTRPGSVGRATGTFEIAILNERQEVLGAGEIGDVYMRDTSNRIDIDYVGATLEVLPGGWSTFGDVGWLDEKGYLYIGDRRKDLIRGRSGTIYPLELEGEIERHPAVRSAIVVGLANASGFDVVHAVVDAPYGDVSSGDLRSFLRECLPDHCIPTSIEFVSGRLRDDAGKARRSKWRMGHAHQSQS